MSATSNRATSPSIPLSERVLGWASGIGDDDPSLAPERARQVRGLQLFLLLHVCARGWLSAFPNSGMDASGMLPLAIVASVALGLALLAPSSSCPSSGCPSSSCDWTRAATGIAALAWTARLYLRWPQSSNHFYLELLCLWLVFALGARGDDNRKLLLQSLRWVVVIAIFYTGAQKVLYGSYFQGQFLAWEIATKQSFAFFFEPFMSAEEFSRLRHIHPERLGAGPFLVSSPIFLAMSNSVYLIEMLTPFFLLHLRTRVLATLAFGLFMIAVETGALELLFGMLMINLLLLFLPRAINYRALPAVAACYAALFAARYVFGLEFFN